MKIASESLPSGTYALAKNSLGRYLSIGAAARPRRAPVTANRVALVSLSGVMARSELLDGILIVDTSRIEREVRAAAADPSVGGILIVVDSGGGSVSGVKGLHDAVAAAAKIKTVYAVADDFIGSAALWAVSGATRLSATPMSMIGSVGAFVVLEDHEDRAKKMGVRVHVVSSGSMKGTGVTGRPVTDEALADAQKHVDYIASAFRADLRRGRRLTAEAMATLRSGRMLTDREALAINLISRIETTNDALARLMGEVARRK